MDRIPSEVLVACIRSAVPQVVAIYAYGSQISGTPHSESDLDLALLMSAKEGVPGEVLLQLQGELEAVAGCPVDVSVLDLASSVVHCREVVTTGKPLYVADEIAVSDFEMRTFSSYAQLCEDRAPVLKVYVREPSHEG